MNELFNEHAKNIRIYMATETETDPYEHSVGLIELHPLPIKAIITDLISSQIQWKIPGITTYKAKEIIITKKYRSLIEKSVKIEIDGEDYIGWKQNGKMQIRNEGEYSRIYCYIKQS